MERIDLRGITVVSWDVDGTLYSLREMVWWTVRLMFRGIFSRRWRETWRDLWSIHRFRRAMNRVRSSGGDFQITHALSDRQVALDAQAYWYSQAIERVGLQEGIGELLDLFDARGMRQVVLSDYPSNAKLQALGLSGRFDVIYSAEVLGYLKPSHRLFELVCADLGITPDQLLHIGDRPSSDGAAAEAVGFRAVVFGADGASPTALLQAIRSTGEE